MNKQELIDAVAASADISKATAEVALNAFMSVIEDQLKNGNDVSLIGFGSWVRRQRAARAGRNPQTGKAIAIPASMVVQFKVGKKLKDAVNNAQ